MSSAMTLPLVLTVALAAAALVGIAVYVRRARRSGTLSGVNAAASGVTAAGVLVSALLVSVALGSATAASAATPTSPENSSASHVPTDLGGFQLPTK